MTKSREFKVMNNMDKAQKWIRDNERELIRTLSNLMPSMTGATNIVHKAGSRRIHYYKGWSKTTVGYSKRGKIYYNTRNSDGIEKCIDFLIHESCHLIGMKHDATKWYKNNGEKAYKPLVYRLGFAAADYYRGVEGERV